jgi:uncharacterized membrane protein YgcG
MRRCWIILSVLLLTAPMAAVAQGDFGQPAAGQRVYDRAGILSPAEIASLEQEAAAVADAGAPIVVYLRRHDADYDETVDDGRSLMDAWDVQSRPDARDGIVLFFNLTPDDPRHGQFALIAGAAHYQEGNLPQRELDRITDAMKPPLRDERTAEGIATGLRLLAGSLRHGPPPPPEPSAFQQLADDLTRGPVSVANAVALAVSGVAAALTYRAWPRRKRRATPSSMEATVGSTLPPALAGALAVGRVDNSQLVATILDLAQRGALAVEPEPDRKNRQEVLIRLLDESLVRPGYEALVWESLTREANDGIVASKRVGHVSRHWGQAREALNRELEQRGWFDPGAGRTRRPFYLVGSGLIVLAILAFVLALYAEQPWAIVGAGLLLVTGMGILLVGASIPNRTAVGDAEASPWFWFQDQLKAAARDVTLALDLDRVMPYAVATGSAGKLDKRLKAAAKQGYAPAWLGASADGATWNGNFYPYWAVFNGSLNPTSSGAGSSGGASSGSGASGGSF